MIRTILTHTSTYNQNQPDFLLPHILIYPTPEHHANSAFKFIKIRQKFRKIRKEVFQRSENSGKSRKFRAFFEFEIKYHWHPKLAQAVHFKYIWTISKLYIMDQSGARKFTGCPYLLYSGYIWKFLIITRLLPRFGALGSHFW